jgi:hypothetical protein
VEFVIVLAILAIVVLVVSGPLRRAANARPDSTEPEAKSKRVASDRATAVADLEAAREAKYREIRDAELDHRTGKLSDADYEAIDRALRVEAIDILRALDRAQGRQLS